MSLQDFLKPRTAEESEFYKFAKEAFDKTDIEMKTDIDFAMLYACMHTYIEYVEKHKFPSKLLKELMLKFYMLRISKKGRGRNDIVEITKNQQVVQQQKQV